MQIQILNGLKKALAEITPTKMDYLVQAIDQYEPGSFASRFAEKIFFILGDSVYLYLDDNEPTLTQFDDGIAVNESFTWKGLAFKSDHDELIPLFFKHPFIFHFQNFIDLDISEIYPRQSVYPTENELLESITNLFIDNLGSVSVLYFFVKNEKYFKKIFEPVYKAMGPGPFHEGVMKLMAEEPVDHARELSTKALTPELKNRKSVQQDKDIKRCYEIKIQSGEKTWVIPKDEASSQKTAIYEEAIEELKKTEALPTSVLTAFQCGMHQSGFFNEAAIAVAVWVTISTDNSMTLLDTDFKRESEFIIADKKIEVRDHCEWYWAGVPPEMIPKRRFQLSSSSSSLTSSSSSQDEREKMHLTKPVTLIYRYTLSESEGKLLFRIKELSLKNKSELMAKVPKKVINSFL